MTPNTMLDMIAERLNGEINNLKKYANRKIETVNVRSGGYTVICNIGDGASITRNDKRNTFYILHDYLDPIGSLNADEAEQMAWELLAAAGELRRIEREHATDKGNNA